MTRTLTAAAIATAIFAAALPASAQAATVEAQIGTLIAERASKSNKGALLPLKHGAVAYAQQHGIAGLEATGAGSVQPWPTGAALSVPYWTDASRSVTKTLGCNQNYSKTTCEIR